MHESPLRRLSLASDTCVTSWSSWTRERIADIVNQVARQELDKYVTLTYLMWGAPLPPHRAWRVPEAVDESGTRKK